MNASIEEKQMPNYRIISRRDRSEGENRGGVATYARVDVCNFVEIKKSFDAECIWHFLHLDIGTVATCNWYRPVSGGGLRLPL